MTRLRYPSRISIRVIIRIIRISIVILRAGHGNLKTLKINGIVHLRHPKLCEIRFHGPLSALTVNPNLAPSLKRVVLSEAAQALLSDAVVPRAVQMIERLRGQGIEVAFVE